MSITTGELTLARTNQAVWFWDTCVIYPVVETRDTTREMVESWPTGGSAIMCRLDMRGGRERHTQRNTVLPIDAMLRLPLGTTITVRDRIQITHRHGTALATPLTFGVVSYPQRGPTALTVDLEVVTL